MQVIEMMDLKKFLNKNKDKDIVVVQGLGFVGAVMSLVISNSSKKDYAVIGVDLKENDGIINSINNGIFPIKSSDRQVEEFYQNSIKKGNFLATNDVNAYSHASTIIVDINLDVQKKAKSVISNNAKKSPNIPTVLEEELKTNIFLRCCDFKVKEALNLQHSPEEEIFTKLRDLKDAF